MANQDLAAVAAVLNQQLEEKFTNVINRSTPFFQIANVVTAKQDVLRWGVVTGTATPTDAGMAEGADITAYNADTKVKASLDFTTYFRAFAVTGPALSAAAMAGPEAIVDLFEESVMEQAGALASAIENDSLNGPGTSNRMLGIFGTAGGCRVAGTYAGLDRATYTQWRAAELLNGGVARALTVDLMRSAVTAIYDSTGEAPDFIMTSSTQFDAYGALLGANRRYMQDITLAGGRKITLDAGFLALEMDGIPVIRVRNMPAGKMLFGCSKYLFIQQRPDPSEMVTKAMRSIELRGTPEKQYGDVGAKIKARIQPLAIIGDKFPFALINYPIVQVKKPTAFATLGDLI